MAFASRASRRQPPAAPKILTEDMILASVPDVRPYSVALDPKRDLIYTRKGNDTVVAVSSETFEYVYDLPRLPDASEFTHTRLGMVFDAKSDRLFIFDSLHQRLEVWAHIAGGTRETPPVLQQFIYSASLDAAEDTDSSDSDAASEEDADVSDAEQDYHTSRPNKIKTGLYGDTMTLDTKRDRLILSNQNGKHITMLSTIDFSYYRVPKLDRRLGIHSSTRLIYDRTFDRLLAVNIDIIHVLTMHDDGLSPLFVIRRAEYTSPGFVKGACVDNHGRIIVCYDRGYYEGYQLHVFSPSGRLSGALDMRRYLIVDLEEAEPTGRCVAFDAAHERLMLLTTEGLIVMKPHAWLPRFQWDPTTHAAAPIAMQRAVETVTVILSRADEESVWAIVPNEISFGIFGFL